MRDTTLISRRAALAVAVLALAAAAAAAAAAETFDLQAYVFCPTGTWCSHPGEQSLIAAWYVQVAEMNLEYAPTGIGLRPKPPTIIQDGRVTPSDVDIVQRCLGVDLLAEPIGPWDGDDLIPPPVPNDPAAEVEHALCRGTDLDGDRVVSDADVAAVTAALGGAPGPAGVTLPSQLIFSDGFESGSTSAWSVTVP